MLLSAVNNAGDSGSSNSSSSSLPVTTPTSPVFCKMMSGQVRLPDKAESFSQPHLQEDVSSIQKF